MMKSLPGAALMFAFALALGGAAFEPAEAGSWYIGGGFRVGGAHFSLAFDQSHRYARPHPYYRTQHRIRHRGYRCGSHCLKRSGYIYHHAACPLVLHHFRRHHFHPARIWDQARRPAPYHRDYHGDRYDYDGRYHSDYRDGYGYDSHRGRSGRRGYDHDHDSDSDSGY